MVSNVLIVVFYYITHTHIFHTGLISTSFSLLSPSDCFHHQSQKGEIGRREETRGSFSRTASAVNALLNLTRSIELRLR
jgi:hypothetical protein